MKTQLHVYVKGESAVSRVSRSMINSLNMVTKSKILMYLDDPDGKPQTLKQSKEPYVFDLAPGVHRAVFMDGGANQKRLGKMLTGAFLGFTAGATLGGMGTGLLGALSGADSFDDRTVHDGIVDFGLQEGDVLAISVRALRKGVEIKKID